MFTLPNSTEVAETSIKMCMPLSGKGWKWHGGHEMKFISRTWVTDADVYGTIHNLGPGHERELGRFGGFAMLMKMGVGGSE